MNVEKLTIIFFVGLLLFLFALHAYVYNSLGTSIIVVTALFFAGLYMLISLKIDVGVNNSILSKIITAVIGIVAGWLASFVMGGGGLLRYIITGIIGSFVGSHLLTALKIDLGIGNPLVSQILTATIGAIVVVFLARLIA